MNAEVPNGQLPDLDACPPAEANAGPDAPVLEAVDLLYEALARLHRSAFGRGLVQINLRLPGQLLTVESRPMPPPTTAGGGVPPFSEEERQIVLALDTDEAPGVAIARRLGQGFTTRLKLLLANLASRGVLAPGRNGYRVADPRFLDIAREEEGPKP